MFDNLSFEDDFLLDYLRKKLELDVLSTVKRKVFTPDHAQKLVKCKGKWVYALIQCGGTVEEILSLYDALQDCRAVAKLLKTKKVGFTILFMKYFKI